MMRQITKACFTNTASDSLLPNVNNNNAIAPPEFVSSELPEVTTPVLTTHSARTDDKGSAGESLSLAGVKGGAVEAAETKDLTASADLSSTGYVVIFGKDSE